MNDVTPEADVAPEPIIRDNTEASRYEAVLGDQIVGTVFYERVRDQAGGRIIIRSTVVDPQMRGHGIGSKIVRAALDDARAKGESLTSHCSFVDEFLAGHAEYADLVQGPGPGPRPADQRWPPPTTAHHHSPAVRFAVYRAKPWLPEVKLTRERLEGDTTRDHD